jgi:RimJ/RimL family protein N-acetyltransferase
MEIVPYKAEHLLSMEIQPGQYANLPFVTGPNAKALEVPYSYTIIADDIPIAVGGIIEYTPERALMWSFLDHRAGRHFISLHRSVSRLLEILPYRRIEAECDCDFSAGHRWLKKLGFKLEAPRMRAYLQNGGDAALYARVR